MGMLLLDLLIHQSGRDQGKGYWPPRGSLTSITSPPQLLKFRIPLHNKSYAAVKDGQDVFIKNIRVSSVFFTIKKVNSVDFTIFPQNIAVNYWSWGLPGDPMVKTLPDNARGAGLILGWGSKIPPASWPKKQNIKQKQYCDEFNKDFKNGPYREKKKNLKRDGSRGPMRPCFLCIMVSQQLQFEPLETDPHSVMMTEEKLPKGSNTQSKTWPLKGVLAVTPSPVQAPTQGPSIGLFCLFPILWHPPPPSCL